MTAWTYRAYRDRCTICGEELKDCPDLDRHGWETDQLRAPHPPDRTLATDHERAVLLHARVVEVLTAEGAGWLDAHRFARALAPVVALRDPAPDRPQSITGGSGSVMERDR